MGFGWVLSTFQSVARFVGNAFRALTTTTTDIRETNFYHPGYNYDTGQNTNFRAPTYNLPDCRNLRAPTYNLPDFRNTTRPRIRTRFPKHGRLYTIPPTMKKILKEDNCTNLKVLIDQVYPVLLQPVSPKNYTEKFHLLLFLEEMFINIEVGKLSRDQIFFEECQECEEHGECGECEKFLCLEMPGLSEQRPSLTTGDKVIVTHPTFHTISYVGFIRHTTEDTITVKFDGDFKNSYKGTAWRVEFECRLSSIQLTHWAVDQTWSNLGKDTLFPVNLQPKDPLISIQNKGLVWHNKDLNFCQQIALTKILNGQCRPLPYVIFGPPGTGKTATLTELILQLFRHGSGKILVAAPSNSAADLLTKRLIQSGQLTVDDIVRIVAFGRSMETIDDDIKPFCSKKNNETNGTHKPLGFHKPLRSHKPLGTQKPLESQKTLGSHKPLGTQKPLESQTTLGSHKPLGTQKPLESQKTLGFHKPLGTQKPLESQKTLGSHKPLGTNKPLESYKPLGSQKPLGTNKPLESYKPLGSHKITVGTCASIAALPDNVEFSYVVIDEAGFATEPQALIPMSYLADDGLAILAGDPHQLRATVMGQLDYGLAESLLARIMDNDLYKYDAAKFPQTGGYNPSVITRLNFNYRSVPDIIAVPNYLFYHSTLIPRNSGETGREWEIAQAFYKLHPIRDRPASVVFHGIRGKEYREPDSTSWLNREEYTQARVYVKELLSVGILPEEIGIISPYRKQVMKLRNILLKELRIDSIKIGSVEEFQGQERMVMIMSTVRSSSPRANRDNQKSIGFLADYRRFNVAVTRAQALLIVIGNPNLLSVDQNWRQLIEFCLEAKTYIGCKIPHLR